MKKFVWLIIVFLVVVSCKNETPETTFTENVIETQTENAIDSTYCDCTELIFDQPYNHFYRFERRKGFTGKCEEFYSNGNMKVSKNFVEGKLHGKMMTYFENGKIHEEKEFDMNFQIGEGFIYTNKGEVKFHALYKRGKQDKILVNHPELIEEDPWAN